jgi:hypothetical protein
VSRNIFAIPSHTELVTVEDGRVLRCSGPLWPIPVLWIISPDSGFWGYRWTGWYPW